jgi:hypothetical protein
LFTSVYILRGSTPIVGAADAIPHFPRALGMESQWWQFVVGCLVWLCLRILVLFVWNYSWAPFSFLLDLDETRETAS